MGAEHTRRPRRNPLTAEEVAEIIALKKRRAHFKMYRFKRTPWYKILNIFNILCFFLYLELIVCFYGTGNYAAFTAAKVTGSYGNEFNGAGLQVVNDIELETEQGRRFKFVVNNFREIPPAGTVFFVGKDYLLGKELKGMFKGETEEYRIFAAIPILFLSVLVLVASFIGFLYNLNEHAYSLNAISVLNGMTVLGIICF